jgi:HK97 family phage prohead protease
MSASAAKHLTLAPATHDPEPAAAAVMTGHFAVWNQWTEINSKAEGHFLERVARGAFAETIANDRIVAMYQHGHDPIVGEKPLGRILSLREDETGVAYEVALYTEAQYVRELLPALRDGNLGASFRFRTMVEDYDPKPARSSYNPTRLPERTLRRVRVFEFGPVVFGAYPSATAGLRSSFAQLKPRLSVVSSTPPASRESKPFQFRFVSDPRRST